MLTTGFAKTILFRDDHHICRDLSLPLVFLEF